MHVAAHAGRTVAVVAAPFGAVAIETEGECVRALRLLPPTAGRAPSSDAAAVAVGQLQSYFADPEFRFDLPLAVHGTPFQCRVWDAIAAIPSGATRRYGDLAAEIDAPARAIGQACGDNRLPIVIPCHRVVGAQGIGGFAHATDGFALTVKRWLLEHEGALRGPLL